MNNLCYNSSAISGCINGISLDKTLKACLWEIGSPFLPWKTKTGLLVAKAHSLRMWKVVRRYGCKLIPVPWSLISQITSLQVSFT